MRSRIVVAVVVACLANVAAAQGPKKAKKEHPPHPRGAIAGVVTGAGTVTVSLAGPAAASTTTDASGAYAFTGLPRGSYTVSAAKLGYGFSPASRTVEVKNRPIGGQDFAGAGITWALDGTTWSICKLEENMPQDEWESFTFVGDQLFRTQLEYASTDSTCTGAFHGDVENAWSATYGLGAPVEVPLDGALVTARELFVGSDSGSLAGVLYVDTARDPDVLRIGVDDAPELWARPYVQEGPSAVTAPALQGTWSSCNSEGIGDFHEVLAVSGYRIAVTGTSYPSNDGSCTGAPTPAIDDTVLYVLRGAAPATLGGTPVVARELDAVGASQAQAYTIAYLDPSTTPPTLYVGDELADPGRDGSAPDRRPNVLQAWRPRVKQP